MVDNTQEGKKLLVVNITLSHNTRKVPEGDVRTANTQNFIIVQNITPDRTCAVFLDHYVLFLLIFFV